jgi:hypothetical protein
VSFNKLFAGQRKPLARIEVCSLPTIRLLLERSDRLTLLTSYELMYEESTLTPVPFAPIQPAPMIGLTMREDWLPTQRQATFIELIRKRIVQSLMRAQEPLRVHPKTFAQRVTQALVMT